MSTIKTLDVSKYSGEISVGHWQDVYNRGYDLAIVGAWHGTTSNLTAPNTIANARKVGMKVAAYTVLNAESGSKSVHEAIRACGDQSKYLSFMALDVELRGLTHQIFNDAANELIRGEIKGCVYTRYSFWHDDMGNPEWGMVFPLWDAEYDDKADLALAKPFGGWTSAVGKQFHGSTNKLGFNADLSVFDAEWVG